MTEVVNADDIRSIILNAHKIKKDHKCHRCNGTGWENWNGETGDDIKAGRLKDYDGVRTEGECETCKGVGYVDVFLYSE
jgi:hypothetical protein